jgi:hypothetical protein
MDHRSPAEVELESIERSLNTVVVGLEILTGICAGIEESDEVEEVEEPGKLPHLQLATS